MTDSKRSKITDVHRLEATKLKALWDDRKQRTQAEFGEVYGLGNQANVGHYLLGRSPLNVKAALAFATELRCKVSDFSARLAAELEPITAVPLASDSTTADELEKQLLNMFRALPMESKDMVLHLANGLYNAAKPGPSNANPYAHVAPPPSIATPPAPKTTTRTKPQVSADH
jgi:hypothetical protein